MKMNFEPQSGHGSSAVAIITPKSSSWMDKQRYDRQVTSKHEIGFEPWVLSFGLLGTEQLLSPKTRNPQLSTCFFPTSKTDGHSGEQSIVAFRLRLILPRWAIIGSSSGAGGRG
jgi:hypothetical protein